MREGCFLDCLPWVLADMSKTMTLQSILCPKVHEGALLCKWLPALSKQQVYQATQLLYAALSYNNSVKNNFPEGSELVQHFLNVEATIVPSAAGFSMLTTTALWAQNSKTSIARAYSLLAAEKRGALVAVTSATNVGASDQNPTTSVTTQTEARVTTHRQDRIQIHLYLWILRDEIPVLSIDHESDGSLVHSHYGGYAHASPQNCLF